MRLRGRKGIRESLEAQPELVVLDAKGYKGRWREFFGNDNPIYIELGMGKGRFISQMSGQNPQHNYIGVDMYDELLRRASEKARAVWEEKGEERPPNLALLRANIEDIESMFDPGEIRRIYLNFSDPWPKSKHARRRLTHPRFLAKYAALLDEHGDIQFKTDSRSLFEFSLNSFAEMELLMHNISLDLHQDGIREDLVLTEYESKFIDKGQPIYRLEALVGATALRAYRERRDAAYQANAGQKETTSKAVTEPSAAPAATSEG
ncbi:tRNA (guanosine(46)-N7)-methyltransferase TrmB [Paenibacillus sp. 1P07SE]|uniref:tRNA (guanosine(46)-N7)-methyltransferase TrmB n=1 Tax=Paenibacillus sp. 1P07SE TaxID=3132209 RepID=UPI0039A4F4CE